MSNASSHALREALTRSPRRSAGTPSAAAASRACTSAPRRRRSAAARSLRRARARFRALVRASRARVFVPRDAARSRRSRCASCASRVMRRGYSRRRRCRSPASFEHFARQLGLDDPVTLSLESPFDYRAPGARLSAAGSARSRRRPITSIACVDAVLPVLEASRGRAFLLFTSHRALRRAAESAAAHLPFPLFVQGTAPRHRLLTEFRASGNGVLLGAASFWEGVDVAGEALSVVVIDKLPFAAPDDPVLVARLDALREAGGNPFTDWQIPAAVIALKQGAGRLIRDVADRGVLVLCDPRLTSRAYGKLFLQACRRCRGRASWPTFRLSSRDERTSDHQRRTGAGRRSARPGRDQLRPLHGDARRRRLRARARSASARLDDVDTIFVRPSARWRTLRGWLRDAIAGDDIRLSMRINVFSRALRSRAARRCSEARRTDRVSDAPASPTQPLRVKSFTYERDAPR